MKYVYSVYLIGQIYAILSESTTYEYKFLLKKDSYAYLFKCKYRNMAFLVSNIDWALSYIFEVFLAHSCQFRYLYYL